MKKFAPAILSILINIPAATTAVYYAPQPADAAISQVVAVSEKTPDDEPKHRGQGRREVSLIDALPQAQGKTFSLCLD